MNIHIKSVLAALAYSLLFYSKSLGINLILISVIVAVLLTTLKKESRASWGYFLAYIFTAVMVFIDPTGYKIFVHLMTLLVLVGKSISNKSSLYLSWLVGAVNMLIASVTHINAHLKTPKTEQKKLAPKTITYIKGAVITLVLLILFTLLYRTSNPIFNNLIDQIDLSFISVPWLFFTLLGYLLFLHILRPYYPKELIALDASQKNDLQRPVEPFQMELIEKLKSEHTLGSIVLVALNVLLLFFLVTDSIYLYQEEPISHAGYSQSVHEGVYALMLSIVCAIAIILYFFRGKLNFMEANKRLKTLAYSWICLNAILVAFTWYKNYEYVEALGFTYKRIGVFVYLLLTLTGLITTYFKVAATKSFIYLVRTNLAVVFSFLFLSAGIPWDRAITWHNLEQLENPDIEYLIDLGDTNSDQLHQYANRNNENLHFEPKTRIQGKYTKFLGQQEKRTWQEYTLYQFKNRGTK